MGQRLSRKPNTPTVAKGMPISGVSLSAWRDDDFRHEVTQQDISEGLPTNVGAFVLYDVLSASECQQLIAGVESIGYPHSVGETRGGYNTRKRLVIFEDLFTSIIWERIAQFVPTEIACRVRPESVSWDSPRLNNAWRFCKYVPGQLFSPHVDSVFKPDRQHKSLLTVMLYLDGGFGGGATNFLRRTSEGNVILNSIEPVAGMCIVFDHLLFHEGAELQTGEKHIARSEVIFERRELTAGT